MLRASCGPRRLHAEVRPPYTICGLLLDLAKHEQSLEIVLRVSVLNPEAPWIKVPGRKVSLTSIAIDAGWDPVVGLMCPT